jgi:Holliday junction resolvasome RuvABC endonuclease subunit
VSLDALAQFREEPKPLRNIEEEYRYEGWILAVDQSIANSGWAYVWSDRDTFRVEAGGNLKTDPIDKGHEDTLQRAVECFRQYMRLLGEYRPDVIVHELPPVGNHMARPESSLVSATALRTAAHAREIPIKMVGAQHAKKVITGNGNAKKYDVKTCLLHLVPDLALLKPLNEAIIDAVALAWVAAREAT